MNLNFSKIMPQKACLLYTSLKNQPQKSAMIQFATSMPLSVSATCVSSAFIIPIAVYFLTTSPYTCLLYTSNGINIEAVLEEIVHKIPAPKGDPNAPLKALIFDSKYDSYRGVIVFCRIMEGTVKKGDTVRMMATGAVEEVVEVGYFGAGQFIACNELSAGMVGYITASIKNVRETRVGDTITDNNNPAAEPLPGYKKVNPMVYCGLYPADGAKYPDLRDALEKLQLNDASLQYEPCLLYTSCYMQVEDLSW